MRCAVEMYFDTRTEARVRTLRQKLVQAGLPVRLDAMGERPHISLAVFDQLNVERLRPLLRRYARLAEPVSIILGAVGMFPTSEGVLFLAPAPNINLMDAHMAFQSSLEPLHIQCIEYYRPRTWLPHCTLASGLDSQQIARAMELCHTAFEPVAGHLLEVGIACYGGERVAHTEVLKLGE
jgi:2'-5' RNA ligase